MAGKLRPLTVLAVGLGLLTFLSGLALAVLIAKAFGAQDSLWVAVWIGPPLVGGVTAGLRPRNPVGWLLLGLGAVGIASQFAYTYSPKVPLSDLAAVVMAFGNALLFLAMMLVAALILYFPSGQVPAGGRRRPIWAGGFIYVVIFASSFFVRTFSGDAANSYPNPLAPHNLAGAITLISQIATVLSVGLLLVVAWDAGQRLRQAQGVQRQQLKWLAYASFLLFPAVVFTSLAPEQWWWSALPLVVAANGVAASIGLSIVRYRLYDIDRLVSRTVAYLIIVGLLGGVYAGSVLLMTSVLPLRGSVSVVIAVLIAVALFAPVRSRARAAVDKRFNRSRYNAQAVVDAFAGRLGEQVTLEAITSDLLDAVDRTVQPSQVSLWLR